MAIELGAIKSKAKKERVLDGVAAFAILTGDTSLWIFMNNAAQKSEQRDLKKV